MSEERFSPECETVQPELNAYLDGELSPVEHAAIEHHLESCAACREELALLRLVTRSLRLAPQPAPSEAMHRRLLAQVSAELPLRRMEILCTERHGGETIRRREVRMYRETALLPDLDTVTAPPISPVIQRYRQESGYRSSCCHVIESLREERP